MLGCWKHASDIIVEDKSYKDCKIVMADEETVIDKRYEIDMYVKGYIGMVKKSMIIYDSNGTKPTSSWGKSKFRF